MLNRNVFWLLMLSVISVSASANEPVVVIENVHVLSMQPEHGEAIQERQSIILEGDRIVAIGPVGSLTLPANAKRIAGNGLYALPGPSFNANTVDHLDGYLQAVDGLNNPVSDAALRELARFTRAHNVAVVPTQALWQTIIGAGDAQALRAYPYGANYR